MTISIDMYVLMHYEGFDVNNIIYCGNAGPGVFALLLATLGAVKILY